MVVAAAKGDAMFESRTARTDKWEDRLAAGDDDFRMWRSELGDPFGQ